MDFSQVKELLALVDHSELTEFDLQIDNVTMRMSKNSISTQQTVQTTAPNQATEAPSAGQHQNAAPQTASSLQKDAITASETIEVEEIKEGHIVQSPLVGVTYMAPSPDQDVFKKVGDPVTVGETLCIVEAMKLMNEIKSDIEGTIAEVFIEDEQVVEYNQPLFRIV
ncbi:MAG: acetyl-CoA carboxylase biotin carboxyl carrier protein [Carnobacterium sp.]|uniref:Biotin carboxyl carrier protein of acetyl-CoA carboxylase n=1 Tax=Carnobacterium antarcticum TaxID=2126436 RepID=A0ABW4NMX6_9LACT|nr:MULTISPECIES: acetyl-CoA carboxylase biotin carboxyl carrier protein [unclassified Carnobacterium]ALV21095.1 Biotin carboxyl carrier protein of acetyl-CoA carboxylase [Carnobacterium sp. CP1]QQP71239.1 acetyl-CoA carboxylase biotin carboxyl carrier protein [Carnobacterium sp. CS13]